MLTIYGPDGEVVAVPLLPKRALTLAQELLTRGVQAIKADSWDAMYGHGGGAHASRVVNCKFNEVSGRLWVFRLGWSGEHFRSVVRRRLRKVRA